MYGLFKGSSFLGRFGKDCGFVMAAVCLAGVDAPGSATRRR
jgi:hypothetical protein